MSASLKSICLQAMSAMRLVLTNTKRASFAPLKLAPCVAKINPALSPSRVYKTHVKFTYDRAYSGAADASHDGKPMTASRA